MIAFDTNVLVRHLVEADYIILEDAERAGCTLATFDRGLIGDRGARVL